MKKYIKNPMAKDLMHPKYKPRVIPNKKKPKRKQKHKNNELERKYDTSISYRN